jgi:hypothetical protein
MKFVGKTPDWCPLEDMPMPFESKKPFVGQTARNPKGENPI